MLGRRWSNSNWSWLPIRAMPPRRCGQARSITPQTRVEKALGYLDRAVDLRPDFADARLALGRVLLDLERVSESTEHLEKAVELNPGNAASRYQLARAYRLAGNKAGQREQLAEYRRLQAERRDLDQRILLGTPQPGPQGEATRTVNAR